jgi:molybdenum cofactor biosynthesis enzyme MoaA
MKIDIYSILAGSQACNARCPYCISKMTPPQGVNLEEPIVNWRNFTKGALLAKQLGATTAMLTGKGEPLLFPDQISKYLQALGQYNFPMIEIQTNGILLQEQRGKYSPFLKQWYEAGLNTIALSIVHFEQELNRQIYLPYRKEYINLPSLINDIHEIGYSVRLSCTLFDGGIDGAQKLEELVNYARWNRAEQLTVRPVNKPGKSQDHDVEAWTITHQLKASQLEEITSYIETNATPLMSLSHGGIVYDMDGQNLCFSNSLTINPSSEDIRQLIFFPDGHLRYDWQYKGAMIL